MTPEQARVIVDVILVYTFAMLVVGGIFVIEVCVKLDRILERLPK